MKKEKVYKTIHLLYTGAVFTALAIGFSQGLVPVVLICSVSAPVYYQFIKRWRRKRGVVRSDGRTAGQHKKIVFISFWIVFMATYGFYYVTLGARKIRSGKSTLGRIRPKGGVIRPFYYYNTS